MFSSSPLNNNDICNYVESKADIEYKARFIFQENMVMDIIGL